MPDGAAGKPDYPGTEGGQAQRERVFPACTATCPRAYRRVDPVAQRPECGSSDAAGWESFTGRERVRPSPSHWGCWCSRNCTTARRCRTSGLLSGIGTSERRSSTARSFAIAPAHVVGTAWANRSFAFSHAASACRRSHDSCSSTTSWATQRNRISAWRAASRAARAGSRQWQSLIMSPTFNCENCTCLVHSSALFGVIPGAPRLTTRERALLHILDCCKTIGDNRKSTVDHAIVRRITRVGKLKGC
jgi:hypothetical protein